MADYIFPSTLSCSQIRARMLTFAKPAKEWGWRLGSSDFYYKFYNDTHFFLIKTRTGHFGGAAMNQPVFRGKIIEKNTGLEIQGRFGLERRLLIIALVIAFLVFSISGAPLLPIIVGVTLVAFIVLMAGAIASSVYREEETEVIKFIEKHLIK